MSSDLFLSIQSSYHCVQLALFVEKKCLDKLVLPGTKASSHLIPHIDMLLKKHAFTLSDLSFIAIDAGPGAFTSLRVAIASVNGIGFTKKIPLVGVDGLEALLQDGFDKVQQRYQGASGVIALLNAYNHDAYFYIASVDHERVKSKGCKKIHEVIIDIQCMVPEGKLLVIGNGALVFSVELQKSFGDRLILEELCQEVPSVERIGLMGYQAWLEQKEPNYRIVPNYLKSQLFAFQK